jgi:hypothetical protein
MTDQPNEDPLEVPELIAPADAGLPNPDRSGHGKMPQLDDDELALIVARERVAAGLEDYVPEDVPPATDPLPEGSSEEADLAQRGLVEEVPADEGDTGDTGHTDDTGA